jgi:hypothetical protein
VADPVSALAWGLLPLFVSVVTFCVTCLPVGGSSTKATRRLQKVKGIPAKKQSDSLSPLARVSVSLQLDVKHLRKTQAN